jgi:hypothetical protein
MRDGSVHIETSPVKTARLLGPGALSLRAHAPEGGTLSEASFAVPGRWPFVRVDIEDECRRCAWTNTLFVER